MKIPDFLSADNVVIDAAAADKKKLLSELARKAGAIVDVLPERLLAELVKREELGSTGMGGGVAIPHARFHQVTKPFGLLVACADPSTSTPSTANPSTSFFCCCCRKRRPRATSSAHWL